MWSEGFYHLFEKCDPNGKEHLCPSKANTQKEEDNKCLEVTHPNLPYLI